MKQSSKTTNIWTKLDDFGTIYGIKRQENETLADYRNRILFEGQYRGNSTSVGLENSLNSQLGYRPIRVITIEVKDGVNTADFPLRAIIKTDNRLIICSRYVSLDDYVVDFAVELREKPYLNLYQLVQRINANSSIYKASLINSEIVNAYGSNDYIKIAKGFTLRNTTNVKDFAVAIPSSTIMNLNKTNIIPGSLIISEIDTLANEVSGREYLLNVPGNYYVDYTNGVIESVSLTSKRIQILGRNIEEPFDLFHTPVSVSSYFSDEVKRYLFEERYLDEYNNDSDLVGIGLPKKELFDTVSKINDKVRITWGK